MNNDVKHAYTAANIKVLKGLEAVKKRPGMYIGNTEDGTGLHHMVYEVLDNCIDEALAGYCDLIDITLHRDGSISVQDNGRGIPIDIHQEENRPAAEVIMTMLHSGGKFDKDTYQISGGLHGVGVSVVNALSSRLILEIKRDGKLYTQEFLNGFPQHYRIEPHLAAQTGTQVRFYPSAQIFTHIDFDPTILQGRFREMSFLNAGVKIIFTVEASQSQEVFYSAHGLQDFVDFLTQGQIAISPSLNLAGQQEDTKVAVTLKWSKDTYKEELHCYTNNIPQMDGGTHLIGLKAGITRAVNTYVEKEMLHKKYRVLPDITGEDVRTGLTAVISVHTPDPRFSSQTKDKLVNSAIRTLVETITHNTVFNFFMENPKHAEQIVEKIVSSSIAREAARKARDINRQTTEHGIIHSLMGVLAFCQEKNPVHTELFLVEGASAGGSAKQARQRKYQAILPLRGKILNVEKGTLEQMLKSVQILNLITAIGTGILDKFNADESKYHKIIIMTDADIDGRHIETLLLTFFYRYMQPLITKGYIYVAQPPLYSVKQSSKEIYLKDDAALKDYFASVCHKDAALHTTQATFTGDPLVRLLQQYNTLIERKKGFASTLNTYVVDVLATQPLYAGTSSWWHTFIDALNLLVPKYQYLAPMTLTYIEDGVMRQQDLTTILHSSYYHELCNHYTALQNTGTVRGAQYRKQEEAFQDIFTALAWLTTHASKHKGLKRYKGLGEMNPEQLWHSTMDPQYRRLLRINIEHAANAELLFNILMGDEVAPRRDFIVQNAKYISFKV